MDDIDNVFVKEDIKCPEIGSPVVMNETSLERKESRCYLSKLIYPSYVNKWTEAHSENCYSLKAKKAKVFQTLFQFCLTEYKCFEIKDAKARSKIKENVLEVKKHGINEGTLEI